MCKFFSIVSDGKGQFMYMDWNWRKDHPTDNNDSHTYIASHFGYTGEKEDSLNKYEYNPLTKVFVVDQINAREDDRFEVEQFCNDLDFSTIIEPLIIKPLINPLKDFATEVVTDENKKSLKDWASVRDSVWAYYSTFFSLKYDYDFESSVKLWESGLIPSFDGNMWRLHGTSGKIVFTITEKALKLI